MTDMLDCALVSTEMTAEPLALVIVDPVVLDALT
jgi:hypothetical protein